MSKLYLVPMVYGLAVILVPAGASAQFTSLWSRTEIETVVDMRVTAGGEETFCHEPDNKPANPVIMLPPEVGASGQGHAVIECGGATLEMDYRVTVSELENGDTYVRPEWADADITCLLTLPSGVTLPVCDVHDTRWNLPMNSRSPGERGIHLQNQPGVIFDAFHISIYGTVVN